MYGMKFSECGHTIDTAENPTIALNKLNQNQDFDAILLDMVMPGMGGVDLINTIKSQFPKLKTKFIVLSNQGQSEDIEKAMAAGALGYIIKAESIPSDVVKKVETLVKQ
jgi:CheY-like chemotaxis protein